jgi:hypothetical protein
MAYGRTAFAVIVAFVVAACGGSGAPSAAPVPTSSDAVTVTPSPSATTSPSPAATAPPQSPIRSPDPTSAAAPPKPSGVTFAEKRKGDQDPSTTEITQTVSWEGPRGEGVEIRVYGVTECIARPANPAPDTSGPCLVEHTPLPAAVRTLLATAPAADGVASWTWTGTFDCEIGLAYDPDGPAYVAVVLAAYGASDHSIFAIAEPGRWWEPGTNDIVC